MTVFKMFAVFVHFIGIYVQLIVELLLHGVNNSNS